MIRALTRLFNPDKVSSMIVSTNPGVLDMRGLRLFGLSAKVNENPRGMFGSGLKHAVAILLRTGHTVTLYRGLERHVFGVKPIEMRGKDFKVVTLDGEELAFGTDLGPHWTVPMAYREIHSNALDEKGETTRMTEYTPRTDQTAIVVEGAEYERAYNQRDLIFLSTTPILSTDKLDIHAGSSRYAYYRGVQVYELPRPSLYTYNLRHLSFGLTEDRTLKDSCDIHWRVAEAVAQITDETFLRTALLAPESAFEHMIGGSWSEEPTDAFVAAYRTLREAGHAADLTSLANATYLRKHKTLPLPPPVTLTRIQQMQLDKAIAFCVRAGWTVTDYPIVVVPHAHGNLLALAEDGKIVLTIRLFDMGVAEVVNALFEEYTHLTTGYRDMTREMQSHLMRQVVCAKAELVGEVL
jgi:hypothetical protein